MVSLKQLKNCGTSCGKVWQIFSQEKAAGTYVPCVHDSFLGLTLHKEKLFELDMIRQFLHFNLIALCDSWLGRRNCSGFFDVGCHVQYICMNWIVLVALSVAIFPTRTLLIHSLVFVLPQKSWWYLWIMNPVCILWNAVLVLVWLLHQKGIFDPIYDWWEDHFSIPLGSRSSLMHHSSPHQLKLHLKRHHHKQHETRHHHHLHHHHHHKHQRRTTIRHHHTHRHPTSQGQADDYHYYLHHVHKDNHGRAKGSSGINKQRNARERNDNKGLVALHRHSSLKYDERRNNLDEKWQKSWGHDIHSIFIYTYKYILYAFYIVI